MAEPSSAFPSPVYAGAILGPAFEFAAGYLFEPMTLANKAHAVMLVERGIVSRDAGAALLSAIDSAGSAGARSYAYDPAVEDLFFAVESRIIGLAGSDAGGNLQLARSRNDLDAVMIRLVLREQLLAIGEALLELRQVVAGLAGRHVETVMPGVTHSQEAQPTTLAHYLLGVAGPLARDGDRFQLAFDHTNQSPLGAAAFTTTSFPIDRDRVADLLGFDGVVENGYDAVGGADYMVEAVGAMRACALSLVRFVNDLLIWSRTEVGVARVGDEFIQISSIMPQKRNPVVLEHIRARVGYVMGDAAAVEAMVQTAAFGDTVDVEDPIYVPLVRCGESTARILTLLTAVLRTIDFNRERLRERSEAGFGASTELAELLTRELGLSFRQAHTVAARIVRELSGAGSDLRSLTPEGLQRVALEATGREITVSQEQLRDAIDPLGFVQRRSISGGPAPVAVTAALGRERDDQERFATWLAERRSLLTRALHGLDERVVELSRASTP